MNMSISIHCTFLDDKREAFVFALSEKIEEMTLAGWDISRPVIVREFTDTTIKTNLLMLSNKQEGTNDSSI